MLQVVLTLVAVSLARAVLVDGRKALHNVWWFTM